MCIIEFSCVFYCCMVIINELNVIEIYVLLIFDFNVIVVLFG